RQGHRAGAGYLEPEYVPRGDRPANEGGAVAERRRTPPGDLLELADPRLREDREEVAAVLVGGHPRRGAEDEGAEDVLAHGHLDGVIRRRRRPVGGVDTIAGVVVGRVDATGPVQRQLAADARPGVAAIRDVQDERAGRADESVEEVSHGSVRLRDEVRSGDRTV